MNTTAEIKTFWPPYDFNHVCFIQAGRSSILCLTSSIKALESMCSVEVRLRPGLIRG